MPPAQPVAERQVKQDQADQRGPDDQRIAEPGIEQPRGAQLDAERGEAGGEDEQVEIAARNGFRHAGIILRTKVRRQAEARKAPQQVR